MSSHREPIEPDDVIDATVKTRPNAHAGLPDALTALRAPV